MPCDNCVRYMKLFNVKKVYYSDKHGNIVSKKINDFKYGYLSKGQKHN
jgi:deoxycytidylate deaminase